jgi:3',5'-cyclic AMP phosphodiesterase CpdA
MFVVMLTTHRHGSASPAGLTVLASAFLAILTAPRSTAGQSTAHPASAIACAPSSVIPIAAPETALLSDASAAIKRFSFIAYGDTRGQYDGRALQPDHEKVVEAMLATIKARANTKDAVRFVLQTGDAVTDGRVAAQWNVSYNPLINRLTVGAEMPYFLTVGNHDVTSASVIASPERVLGLCNYFAANAKLIPPEGSLHRLNGYPDFAFGFGNTFFLAFDSNIADDETQYAWVKAELRQLDRRQYPNVVIFIHQPPISSGPHGGPLVEPATATLRTFFMPLFREHHVRLVLSGHDHLFEHWVERYRDSSGTHRLDQIVTGGGGAPAYAYRGEPDLREYISNGRAEELKVEHLVRPARSARENPLHFLVFTVDGEDIEVEVIGVDRGKGYAPYGRGRTKAVLSDSLPNEALRTP